MKIKLTKTNIEPPKDPYVLVEKKEFYSGTSNFPGNLPDLHKLVFEDLKNQVEATWSVTQTDRSLVIGLKDPGGNIVIFETSSGFVRYGYENTFLNGKDKIEVKDE